MDAITNKLNTGDTETIISQGTELIKNGQEIMTQLNAAGDLNSHASEGSQVAFLVVDTFVLLMMGGTAIYRRFYPQQPIVNGAGNGANDMPLVVVGM